MDGYSKAQGEGSIYRRVDGSWVGRISFEDPVTGLEKRTQVSGSTNKAVSGLRPLWTQPARHPEVRRSAADLPWAPGRTASLPNGLPKTSVCTLLRRRAFGVPDSVSMADGMFR